MNPLEEAISVFRPGEAVRPEPRFDIFGSGSGAAMASGVSLRLFLYRFSALPDNARAMFKQAIKHPDKEKSTGAYSAAVAVDGWVYVSGIGPVDPKTAQPVRGSIEDETRYVLAQMERILVAAGCTRHDIVKCTAHLADMEDFDRYNAVYREFFKDVAVLPARTTVQSVLWNQIKVEIDCVARKPGQPPFA